MSIFTSEVTDLLPPWWLAHVPPAVSFEYHLLFQPTLSVLLPSKSRWAHIFHRCSNLSLSTFNVFYLHLWMKYWFVRFFGVVFLLFWPLFFIDLFFLQCFLSLLICSYHICSCLPIFLLVSSPTPLFLSSFPSLHCFLSKLLLSLIRTDVDICKITEFSLFFTPLFIFFLSAVFPFSCHFPADFSSPPL